MFVLENIILELRVIPLPITKGHQLLSNPKSGEALGEGETDGDESIGIVSSNNSS
jgi:hypothetical protein